MSHYVPPSAASISDRNARDLAHRQWVVDMAAGAEASRKAWEPFGREQQARNEALEAVRQQARQQAERARQQAADDAEQRRVTSAAMATLVGIDASAAVAALRSELAGIMTEVGL
jgi:hypothetical protein